MNTKASRREHSRSKELFPGGVNSPVRAFKGVLGDPLYMARGEGAFLVDADENRFIDYVLSWGPLLGGHAHPRIVQAISETARLGTSFGAPTAREADLAERVRALVPSMRKMRFVSSGTEATASALRVARGFTGRGKRTPMFPTTGSTMAQAVSRPSGRETACAIVEPVVGNMGVLLPRPGFLDALREETARAGALLILDEVMTGFRIARGGAQARFGIAPDLTCLGKVIGGGLPVGAYGGRDDVMSRVAPEGPIYQAGTLSGNPLAMAAGIAMLEMVGQEGFVERVEQATQALCARLREECARARVPAQVNQLGSMWTLFFADAEVFDYPSAKRADTQRFARVHRQLLERGVYLPPSQFESAFVSSMHTPELIERTALALRGALAAS
jgi:glutamate-1-semialdehyde 2,1-aminomutase